MSTAETSGHDPNSIQQDPKRPEETLAPELPPDPLLKSGTFIAVPQDGTTAEPPPQLRRSSDDAAPACLAAEKSNGDAAPVAPAPAPENAASQAETPPRRAPAPAPDWLPAGWSVEDRVRSSGVTAGTVDRALLPGVKDLLGFAGIEGVLSLAGIKDLLSFVGIKDLPGFTSWSQGSPRLCWNR
nr:methyl-cpg-binding domain-containing protein 6 [Quercus suber]